MDHVIDLSRERKAWQAGSPVKASVAMVFVAGLARIPLIALGVVPAWVWVAVHVKAMDPARAWDAVHVKAAVPAWAWVAVRVKAMDPARAWVVVHVRAAVPVWVWDVGHVRAMDPAWVMVDTEGMGPAMVADQCMALAVILRRNNASATLVKRFL